MTVTMNGPAGPFCGGSRQGETRRGAVQFTRLAAEPLGFLAGYLGGIGILLRPADQLGQMMSQLLTDTLRFTQCRRHRRYGRLLVTDAADFCNQTAP